jgi:hypothetical protein
VAEPVVRLPTATDYARAPATAGRHDGHMVGVPCIRGLGRGGDRARRAGFA